MSEGQWVATVLKLMLAFFVCGAVGMALGVVVGDWINGVDERGGWFFEDWV